MMNRLSVVLKWGAVATLGGLLWAQDRAMPSRPDPQVLALEAKMRSLERRVQVLETKLGVKSPERDSPYSYQMVPLRVQPEAPSR